MLDIVKEYLVSLGFKVDNPSLNQAKKAMGEAEKSVSKFAGTSVAQFAAAGAAVSAFVAVATFGIAEYIVELAKADLENDKLARRMWTTKENAAALNNTLKAMGATIEDLYLSPELRKNFFELRQQAFTMRPPEEYKEQMRMVRSIIFEFQRLKLEGTYAMQWIGYYIIKYFEEPLSKAKLTMKDINNMIIKNMPHWTSQIAQVLSWIVRMGIALVRGGKDVIELFGKMSDKIPKDIKIIGAALTALGLLIKTGPLGVFITLFSAALLMLDDFYTYLDGGDSQFSDLWNWVMKNKDEFAEWGDKLQVVVKWIEQLFSDMRDEGILQKFTDNILNLSKNTYDLIVQLTELMNQLSKLAGYKDFGDMLNTNIISVLKELNDVVSLISGSIKTITLLLKGDFKEAFKNDRAVTKDFRNGLIDNVMGEGASKGTKWWDDLLGLMTGDKKDMKWYEPWQELWGSLTGTSTSYTTPTPSTTGSAITLQPTYNIYGSDPNATAKAVDQNNSTFLMRNLQGVQR